MKLKDNIKKHINNAMAKMCFFHDECNFFIEALRLVYCLSHSLSLWCLAIFH